MVRPHKFRNVSEKPIVTYFKPRGIPLSELEELCLPLDGFEALRLADVEGLYHDAAAEVMGISRQTFGQILAQARRVIATAITQGKAVRVEGGAVELALQVRGKGCGQRGKRCRRGWNRS